MAAREHPKKRSLADTFLVRAASLGWSSRRTLEEAKKAGHDTLAGLSQRTISDRLTEVREAALRRNRGKLDKLVVSALDALANVLEFSVADVADYDGGDNFSPHAFEKLSRARASAIKEFAVEAKVVGSVEGAAGEDGEEGPPLEVISRKRKIVMGDKVGAARVVLDYHAKMVAAEDKSPPAPDAAEEANLLDKAIGSLGKNMQADGK